MTTTRNYRALLHARRAAGKRVCVGLDPDPTKLGFSPDAELQTVELELVHEGVW